MKTLFLFLFFLVATEQVIAAGKSLHDFTVKSIEGDPVSLDQFRGQVVMVVNTASRCGFTRQYSDLVELQTRFADRGFTVLAFPANNFGNQEPGSNEEIAMFCEDNFQINFPLFARVSVRGEDMEPLFTYLTTAENPDFTGPIRWNFEKILVGPDGRVVRRFRSMTRPNSRAIVQAVEALLAELPGS